MGCGHKPPIPSKWTDLTQMYITCEENNCDIFESGKTTTLPLHDNFAIDKLPKLVMCHSGQNSFSTYSSKYRQSNRDRKVGLTERAVSLILYTNKPIPCSKNRSPMQSLCMQKLNWLKSNWLNFPRNANDTYPPKNIPSFIGASFQCPPISLNFPSSLSPWLQS